jgi:hypothetical protein
LTRVSQRVSGCGRARLRWVCPVLLLAVVRAARLGPHLGVAEPRLELDDRFGGPNGEDCLLGCVASGSPRSASSRSRRRAGLPGLRASVVRPSSMRILPCEELRDIPIMRLTRKSYAGGQLGKD